MALPLRAALRSASRFMVKNPTTMLSMARHALGMRIAVPLDALRWFIPNTPPSVAGEQRQARVGRQCPQRAGERGGRVDRAGPTAVVRDVYPTIDQWRDVRVARHGRGN